MNLTQISASVVIIGAALFLGLLALPSYLGAIKQSGAIRGLLIIVSLSAIVLAYEIMAVKTHLPYGDFAYSTAFGYKIFGAVPWLPILAYPPVVLGAYWLARKISFGIFAVLLTALFTTAVYLVTAPAMAKLTLWQWPNPGPFYGVPIRSFVGWFVLALISSFIVVALWGDNSVKRLTGYSLFAILLFWSGVNLGISQWIPALIGLGMSILLFTLFLAEKRHSSD